jgi:hypothetical protein
MQWIDFFMPSDEPITIDFNNWQLTMDNWQWNGRLADCCYLTPSALTPLACAVSIAYCLLPLQFPIPLKPSALTPSPCQFPNVIGALSQTLPPFLSWHKKGGKKGQDCARFARKIVVRKAQIVQLVEVWWSFYKRKKVCTNFNFEQGRFLTAFLAYFSAHRPRSRVEKS